MLRKGSMAKKATNMTTRHHKAALSRADVAELIEATASCLLSNPACVRELASVSKRLDDVRPTMLELDARLKRREITRLERDAKASALHDYVLRSSQVTRLLSAFEKTSCSVSVDAVLQRTMGARNKDNGLLRAWVARFVTSGRYAVWDR
jgi:hypothetical protein